MVGSDGGDGLLDALQGHLARRSQVVAAGPFGVPVAGEVGWLDDITAIVETRLFCGLALAQSLGKDPMRASTRGVGEALLQIRHLGARTVYMGLGGSASVDGGTGFARALGWAFDDHRGGALPDGGGELWRCAHVGPAPFPDVRVIGLADVGNRLTGPDGAVVYAPQKGASPDQVGQLGRGLDRLVTVLQAIDPEAAPRALAAGAGASGGLGFGLLEFAGGALVSGAAWVLERIGFDQALAGADLVLTGEGRFDATSWEGKLTGEVIRRARAAGKRVALVAPSVVEAPPDLVVESGGGQWTEADLSRAAERALRASLS